MVAGVSAIFLLFVWLLLRNFLDFDLKAELPSAWNRAGGWLHWAACYAIAIATQIPLLLSASSLLISDATSHAAIAAYLAREGAPHGWIDLFNGGFPLGPHYPSMGWLAASLVIRCGVSAPLAVSGLAVGATAIVPWIALAAGRALGARPVAALACALALGCSSPMSPFVGGWSSYLDQGLFSQTLVMPLLAGWLFSLAWARSSVLPPTLAALCVLTHPQITGAALVIGGATAIALRSSPSIVALGRSLIAAGAVGLAVYGPGIATLNVPFGWPPMEEWKLVGLPPRQLLRNLGDGDLLDAYRMPVITIAWAFSLVIASIERRNRACLAVTVASLVAVLCATGGAALSSLGAVGRMILSFLQPLRALAVVPFVAGACVLVATEMVCARLADRIRPAIRSRRQQLALAMAPWGVLSIAAAPAVVTGFEYGASVRETYRRWTAEDWCGDRKPAGYSTVLVKEWLRNLRRGRFTIVGDGPLSSCPATHGVEIASHVPMGRPIGAGAHVGVNHVAFGQLRPDESDSAGRAEALGIRWVLHTRARQPTPRAAWRPIGASGDMVLSERVGGTDFVGVGCVEREIRGSNVVLHEALVSDLEQSAIQLQNPNVLLRLRTTTGPLRVSSVSKDGCDPQGAVVQEVPREPGAYEAHLSLEHPVDVVIRASAFPTWQLAVDGAPVPVFVVAPGFFAARVPAGNHHVVATVAPLPGYLFGVGLALIIVVGSAIPWRRGSRPATASRARS